MLIWLSARKLKLKITINHGGKIASRLSLPGMRVIFEGAHSQYKQIITFPLLKKHHHGVNFTELTTKLPTSWTRSNPTIPTTTYQEEA